MTTPWQDRILTCANCSDGFRRNHSRQLYCSLECRFVHKIELRDDDCWHWVGSRAGTGHGDFWTGDLVDKAHRVAYEMWVGSIPDGLQIDHLCRVRHCVNPDHLEPVTSRENTLRGVGACGMNARKTHCPQGHAYDESNTLRSRQGHRRCRTCSIEWQRNRYAAKVWCGMRSRTNSERDEAAYEWHMRERLSPQELAEEAGYDPGSEA